MGAAGSRSSPLVETTRIHGYSSLLRPQVFSIIFFSDLRWQLKVHPFGTDELGKPNLLFVSVEIDCWFHDQLLATSCRTDVSIGIEILDETGRHTVFHEETRPGFRANGSSSLLVSRRELEASSCVRNDSFTVRCTMTTKQHRDLSRSKELAAMDAMIGSHTLAIASVCKLKAGLRDGESAYSTRFAVGGCTWYLKFYPCHHGFALHLVRASKHADEPPATAEFSFELEGLVNFESRKMTHTFHYDNKHISRYPLKLSSTPVMHDDRLLIRCHLAVMPPAATMPVSAVISRTESILTPLLSAVYM
ncbi:hypothetical protein D1007_51696 [Hordeum vulgare]|uniref:MATH domain-containing protein n=1 Tax=Hordeum vulgare subsp. vulgare TaxID=112509 RepID=A0A8I6WX56_HORVV|nr:hypothetical protein D1007_51696 [Hordeum vulgare]